MAQFWPEYISEILGLDWSKSNNYNLTVTKPIL